MYAASNHDRDSKGNEHVVDTCTLPQQTIGKETDGNEESENANMLAVGSSAGASDAPPYRTRWLYFMLFVYFACGGRFMSLYYLAEGLNETEVGAVFAVGGVAAQVISTLVGLLADRLTTRSPAARHWCCAACVIVGALAFTAQAVHVPHVSRFAVMLTCRVVTNGCSSSAMILADAITLDGLHDRQLFGQERLYGAISWAIMHIIMGLLLDKYGHVVQHILIIMAAGLVLYILAVIGLPNSASNHVQKEDASPGKKKGPGLAALADRNALCMLLRTYVSSKHIVAFFIYAVTLGYGMSIVENLIFMFFRELDASYFLCGISVVVTVVFEIPLFARSKKLLEKLGVASLLSLAGLCYSIRVVGYTLCPGGWFILLFEPMHGVTIAAFSTASVELVASITPPEFTATGQAFLNLARAGVGSTAGTSIGGAIISLYGESACYRASALVVLFGLLIYWIALSSTPQSDSMPVSKDEPQTVQEEGSTLPVILQGVPDEDACDV